ncbi:hypothetical protein D770_23430 [Flammeovirgaceae bacterium 311]|nr:hypothetical protein D770_23430 [Flammeovirgaceae bacterium 311]
MGGCFIQRTLWVTKRGALHHIKSSITILLFAVLVTFLFGCNSKVQGLINRINNNVDKDGWKYVGPLYKGNEYDYHQLMKEDGDTIKYLHLYHNPKVDTILYRYVRTYTDSTHMYLIGSDNDAFYIYREPNEGDRELEFITGKYFYLYSTSRLTEGQSCYYKMYADSLKTIKGNDLPPLPEISCRK